MAPARQSTMRMAFSGAAAARQRLHTPRFSSNVTLEFNSAVVRGSRLRVGSWGGATTTTDWPTAWRERAAASPAGPAPMTAMSVDFAPDIANSDLAIARCARRAARFLARRDHWQAPTPE